MKVPETFNPFARDTIKTYPGVLVPLAQAKRHSLVAAQYEERRATQTQNSDLNDSNDQQDKQISETTIATEENGELATDSPLTTPYTIEGLRAEIQRETAAGETDSAYDLKSKVINKAIQDIGMGTYNWQLFVLCGVGWIADNLWLQGVALTLPSIAKEYGISDEHVRYTTCSLFTGLCIGAGFWGIGSDILGRRLAFNATLFLAGLFGIAAGGAPSWIGVCGLFAALGTGVGGNLPVDGALFLEFLPGQSSGLLTLLSVFWPIGQLIASLVAWAFIGSGWFSNVHGWRYTVYTLGTLTFTMFLSRFFFFTLYESPKFLLSRGRQAEAVSVVHGIAHKNKTTTWLSEEILNEIGGDPAVVTDLQLSTTEIVRRKLSSFSEERIGPLFSSKRLGITTVLIWFCWLTIGIGYPLFNSFLPQYLAKGHGSSGAAVTEYETYRNYAITSVVGLPGSILACWTVNIPYIGRKGTMAVSTALSGIFLFLFTISADSSFQLAFSSVEAFFQNIMYGFQHQRKVTQILESSRTNNTPEAFPAPNRGTGTGIASFLNRVGGLCAPIIAANVPTGANPSTPVFVSGALFLSAFVAMALLPIETRGKQSL